MLDREPFDREPQPGASPLTWLLLVHQQPAEPSRARVRIWRRLQSVGSVALKNSVYVLPASAESEEHFEWIRAEIIEEGGEAFVFKTTQLNADAEAEVRDLFERARSKDWHEFGASCRELLKPWKEGIGEPIGEAQKRLKALRARARQVDSIDYFPGLARLAALDVLEELEKIVMPSTPPVQSPVGRVEDYQKRIWLTRPRPGVDRMASAWLIRGWIDTEAQFEFAEKPSDQPDAIPFDMFGVEFGHQGGHVTFETLLGKFDLQEPSLQRIARIVRELDLKSESYAEPESETTGKLIEGLRVAFPDDHLLLQHGIALFAALYSTFQSELN